MTGFPDIRLRRLRKSENIRRLVDSSMPGPEKFVWPVFMVEGRNVTEPIDAMPNQERMSTDVLLKKLKPVVDSGITSILLFGLGREDQKDDRGTQAYAESGVVQQTVRAVKKAFPSLVVFTDVCLCAYTTHGHCGPLTDQGTVDNDAANDMLAKVALSHARAGADVVAPSAMMDGQVRSIRQALDTEAFTDTIIMSYSSKFASAMYGPFRDAEQSAPSHGDRKSYQASYANKKQALYESLLDVEEGADILMVKPSLFYLDILSQVAAECLLPVAAYNVSGEYSMLIAAADRGWGNLKDMVRESTYATFRAGADFVISYWANSYDKYLKD